MCGVNCSSAITSHCSLIQLCLMLKIARTEKKKLSLLSSLVRKVSQSVNDASSSLLLKIVSP